jgi:hypothetical protein
MNIKKGAVNAKKANPQKRTAIARVISRKHPGAVTFKNKNGIFVGAPDDRNDWAQYEMTRQKRQKMQVTMEDGQLVIKLQVIDPPRLSGSGKSHVLATSCGVKRTALMVEGRPVRVVATAFIYGYGEDPVRWVPLLDVPTRDDHADDDDDAVEL